MNRHAKASSAGSTRHKVGRTSLYSCGIDALSRRRFRSILSLALAAFVVQLSVVIAGASASFTRNPQAFSPITGTGSGLTIATPGGVAIDETSTNVFLNDGTTKTDILGGEGGTPLGLVAPFTITGLSFTSLNNAVAVDNSATSPNKGTIYIISGTPAKIKKFQRNALTEHYEAVGELVHPLAGANSTAGATVDAQGNLYVGDQSSQSVVKFNTAGEVVKIYNLSASIVRPTSVAVDAAGDLFVERLVAGNNGGSVFKYPADGAGEINPANFVEMFPIGSGATGVAVDSTRNALFVALGNRVAEYDATTLAKKFEFGLGTLGATARLAVDSSTNRVYVADNGAGKKNVAVFGPPVIVPTTKATAATSVTGTRATLNGTVNPDGVAVTECFFEYGLTTSYGSKTSSCEGEIPTDSEDHAVSAKASGLTPNGVTYHYRLVAKNADGTERSADKTLVTGNTVITEAATGVSTSSATLHGTVRPEGVPFSECKFEYKLTTEASFEDEAACVPSAGSIEADFEGHAVSASLSELQPNATYEFRLSATNAQGTVSGEILTFTTVGPPQITEVRALNASQSAATIEGKIDPSGFGTSYRFEWGPTESYGNQVPVDFEPFIGSGDEPVRVSAKLTGLSTGQAYHYRIVATSSAGTTASPDQIVETLNSCGLPEDRCFELVSRRDAGPVAIPGELVVAAEMHYQAATEGSGKVAYPVEAGYPDSTKGAEVLYRGTRGENGWDSTQLSTPLNAPNEQGLGESTTGPVRWLSDDLSCGFAESFFPLTDDPAMRLAREYGGANFYRINSDGSYTGVSHLAPENPEIASTIELGFYFPAGASQDCSKVVFESEYRYPGIDGVGQSRLYEWDEGTLRNVGVVPGPSGEVVVQATAGTGAYTGSTQNTVSEDGSRVFFTAKRQAGPNPDEIGKEAIFVREDGTTTRDLSLSETSIPNEGATYRWATPDGSKVFFTANAGLTDESSSAGTDLYMYDLESEELTDVTPYQGAGGAQVVGFVGAAEDGSRVYFASRNQLVPGRGSTLAENQSEKTLSIYGASNGEFSYVGAFNQDLDREFNYVILGPQREWTSRVSPDGRYLLFESSAKVTGYDSGGAPEAYLYDTQGDSEGTVCVSCRQDGQPSVAPMPNEFPGYGFSYQVLPAGQSINNELNGPQFLTVRDGEPQVFFSSPDVLAPGAVENQNNIYEWSHGQIFRLVSAQEGQQSPLPVSGHFAVFGGASADGSDVYLATPETLNWEDGDERLSIYDARIGGGFPEPPAPPVPCDATSEGSCQGPVQGVPSSPGAASATFNGPGNPSFAEKKQKKAQKKQKKKKKKKAHKKKRKHGKKKQRKRGRNANKHKRTNHNRRAGK